MKKHLSHQYAPALPNMPGLVPIPRGVARGVETPLAREREGGKLSHPPSAGGMCIRAATIVLALLCVSGPLAAADNAAAITPFVEITSPSSGLATNANTLDVAVHFRAAANHKGKITGNVHGIELRVDWQESVESSGDTVPAPLPGRIADPSRTHPESASTIVADRGSGGPLREESGAALSEPRREPVATASRNTEGSDLPRSETPASMGVWGKSGRPPAAGGNSTFNIGVRYYSAIWFFLQCSVYWFRV